MSGADLPDELIAEFAKRYREQIVSASQKPVKPFLLCPVGLIGAGKSTVVVPLAKRLNLVRISTDEVRKLLQESGYNYQKARDISLFLNKQLSAEGHGIAVDGNSGSAVGIAITKEVVASTALPAVWIHINPPEAFIVAKLRNYKHTWLFRDGEHAVMNYFENKELNKDMLQNHFPFLYTFDTSRDDLPQQIEEAAQIIERAVADGTVPPWP